MFFAGWESTTSRLQQAGWSISAEQSQEYRNIKLAMRYEPGGLFMLTAAEEWDFRQRGWQSGDERLPAFNVVHCSSKIAVKIVEGRALAFKPIDAKTMYTEQPYRSIEDFKLFAPCLARTEEIIVEPQTVSALLEKIKSMQAPELAAIRERNRMRDRLGSSEPMQQQRFHAQIVSIA